MFLVAVGAAASGSPVPAGDDGSSEIAQDPRAVCLNGVDVGWGEEQIGKSVTSGLVVEERE